MTIIVADSAVRKHLEESVIGSKQMATSQTMPSELRANIEFKRRN